MQPPTFTAATPPAAVCGVPYSYQFQASGAGPASITYSATGLPGWAQLAPSTGILTGTPTVNGTFTFIVTANNGVSPGTPASVSLIVGGKQPTRSTSPPETAFTVPYGTYTGGTTFNVGAGATVTIDQGTFTGGAGLQSRGRGGRQHHR